MRHLASSSLTTRIRSLLNNPLYRNSIHLMANTVITSGLGFFFWLIVARFYTESEVGLGSALISAMSLLALLSRLGLDTTLVRFLPNARNPVALINSSFVLGSLAAVVATGIFFLGLNVWSPAFHFIRENSIFVAAFFVFTVLWTLSWLVDFVFVARRRADFVVFKNTIFALVKVPLPIVLVLYFHAFGIVASWGLAIGIALAIAIPFLIPRVQPGYRLSPRIDLSIVKTIWRYSTGNYFANLLGAAPGFILPIMIVNLLGAKQNAYFYVAWMIASLLFTIPTAVSQSLLAEGSHFEEQLRTNVKRSYRFVFLLLIPAIVVLLLIAKWLLLLFGVGYSENAATLLRLLVLSGVFVGVNSVYYSILRVERRIRELVALTAFTAISVLFGGYVLMPTTGIIGIGYVWLAVQAFVALYIIVSLTFTLRR
ncbi:MAG: oligosaccharide flippase family protein [Chloroflexota bacterium]|nr:oligosaccharide flippase family protein [Chloroflexota bacterium]